MMSADFHFRDKIKSAILGADTPVGQKLLELLNSHPWLEIIASYSLATVERQAFNSENLLESALIFSVLESEKAEEIERRLSEAGYAIISSAWHHSVDFLTPLIAPEVNAFDINLIENQGIKPGLRVACPHPATAALTLALKPLMETFGVEAAHIVIKSKLAHPKAIENEIRQVLGLTSAQHSLSSFRMTVQSQDHLETDQLTASFSIKMKKNVMPEDLIQAWRHYSGEPQQLQLPQALFQPISYIDENSISQASHFKTFDKQASIHIKQLSKDSELDYQFILRSNSFIFEAARDLLLTAELLIYKGFIFW